MGQDQAVHEVVEAFCKFVGVVLLYERGDVCEEFAFVSFAEVDKGFWVFVFFYVP